MTVEIKNQLIKACEYTPNYKNTMNRFKVILGEDKAQVVAYLFSHRDSQKTKRLKALLEPGSYIAAKLAIVRDPEFNDKNLIMIVKIFDSRVNMNMKNIA